MSYTKTDLARAAEYANDQVNKLLLSEMNKTWPHIISHLRYENKKLIGSEKFLNQFNCNMFRNDAGDLCTDEYQPRYYRTGDHSFRVGCGYACYNLKAKKLDENGVVINQSELFQLDEKKQIILYPTTLHWFEIPKFRDEVEYKNRVNNFPSGFDRNTTTNRYELNETYCNAFAANYRNGKCESKINKVLGVVIGETLLKNALIVLEGTQDRLRLASNATPLPMYTQTLEEWKNDIDPSFSIQRPAELKIEDLTNSPAYSINDAIEIIMKIPGIVGMVITETLRNSLVKLLSPQFWADRFISNSVNMILRKVINTIGQKLVLQLQKVVAKQLSLQVLKASMTYFVIKSVQLEATRLIIKSAIYAVKSFAKFLSIALLVFSIADILLTIIDPLGLNQEIDNKTLDDIYNQFIAQFYENPENYIILEPAMLASMLDFEAGETLKYQYFTYTYQYLSNLKLNSDGVLITHTALMLEDGRGLQPIDTYSIEKDAEIFLNRAKCFSLFRRAMYFLSAGLLISLFSKLYILSLFLMVLITLIIGITYLNLVFNIPSHVGSTVSNINMLFGQVSKENNERFE